MGHRAAESIHRYLSGETVELLPRIEPERVVAPDRAELARARAAARRQGTYGDDARAVASERAPGERLADFGETAAG
jgi:hypothetical protein